MPVTTSTSPGRRAAETMPESNFKEMLYARFGRGIAEKFLIPYNEKLYACDLGALDSDAMGRFFPARGPRRHHPQHAAPDNALVQRDLHLSARAAPSNT